MNSGLEVLLKTYSIEKNYQTELCISIKPDQIYYKPYASNKGGAGWAMEPNCSTEYILGVYTGSGFDPSWELARYLWEWVGSDRGVYLWFNTVLCSQIVIFPSGATVMFYSYDYQYATIYFHIIYLLILVN